MRPFARTWPYKPYRPYPRNRLALLLLAVLLGLAGCRGGSPSAKDQDTKALTAVSRTATQGPVTITLRASSAELDTAQPLDLQLEVVAEKGVTVNVEDYRLALQQDEHHFGYRVTARGEEAAKPIDDQHLRWLYRYKMEFVLPDTYELPPAHVFFTDVRSLADHPSGRPLVGEPIAQTQQVETEPLSIKVRAASSAPLSEEKLREIKTLDPVELPAKWSRWWWLGPLMAVAALVLVRVVLYLGGWLFPPLRRLLPWLRRRLFGEPAPAIALEPPADEWARRELAALVAENLISKGQIKPFYYRISDIVRGYIERRFEVSAREMTTEEFLLAAAGDGRFGPAITTELKRFLGSCDLVKYARYQPDVSEGDRLVTAAGEFVEQTRPSQPSLSPSNVAETASPQREEVSA